GGDFAANGVPADRASEINTCYADAMFTRLLERGEPALARPRPAPDRFVGCCRDATVLFLALARHKGIPARARVGVAAYILPGWPYLAHQVTHDLAALAKAEMLLWDGWGMELGHGPGPVPEADAAVLDEVSARTADPGIAPDVITALAQREGLRIPPTITRF